MLNYLTARVQTKEKLRPQDFMPNEPAPKPVEKPQQTAADVRALMSRMR